MPLLIDGHNLIGAGVFADIDLADEDDEARLVARLRVWKSRYRGKITVVFDRGIPGGRDPRLGGAGVEVIFAAHPAEADDLIRRRIHRRTPGLILVSNDEALLREAAAYGVETWRGQEFVERFTPKNPKLEAEAEPGTEPDLQLSEQEVAEWLALFGKSKTRRRTGKRRPKSGAGSDAPAGRGRQAKARKPKDGSSGGRAPKKRKPGGGQSRDAQ
ncbi:NYN domain-containing protein [Litorilinea aerophila]|uniref:NYN domain-containing protein n=1 Tax=Litorilinea aerophila TaxID=1204385 RepID=A0A540VC55_9CHLR|nr:NYN domain-containing protein [Litorilinea aerophila]MCC9077915.1 NYN domain-containing protein [Litorilinea aerophila]GIV78269.1 MAG: hypothetical protein KatS3mg050_2663 [Litorilinea sp.]